MWMGLINLALAPVAMIYTLLYYLFTVADLTKRDASALGSRSYTNYGR